LRRFTEDGYRSGQVAHAATSVRGPRGPGGGHGALGWVEAAGDSVDMLKGKGPELSPGKLAVERGQHVESESREVMMEHAAAARVPGRGFQFVSVSA
jgi:hypothetical protein